MIERLKTALLIMLVALSLLQSYLLAYSMPGLGATVRSDQDYVNTEPLGATASVESVIFPEQLIIHMGDDRHTVIYPGTQFYDMILKQRIVGREFKGFQRGAANVPNWEETRRNDIGIELRFGDGLPVELLQKLLKIEGDTQFLSEKIDRIWIFKTMDTEEIRTFFFSSDGYSIYESVRADLTVRDVQDYVGFGQYLPRYQMIESGLYVPVNPLQATELVYVYKTYSPEQMQRSLFSDPTTTRAIEDRSGSQIFTDGKRGLKVEQNGMWINYTNSVARQSGESSLSENVYASIDFINQHGGWDGVHRFDNSMAEQEIKHVTFRKYVGQYPVIDSPSFRYGSMRLMLQQGGVTEYTRSLITLGSVPESRETRWLPGGEALESRLRGHAEFDRIAALFPALRALPVGDNRLQFVPVWAIRMIDGREEILTEALPGGYTPPADDMIEDWPEAHPESEEGGDSDLQPVESLTATGRIETAPTDAASGGDAEEAGREEEAATDLSRTEAEPLQPEEESNGASDAEAEENDDGEELLPSDDVSLELTE